MKKNENKTKTNILTGVSTMAGAVVGSTAGTLFAETISEHGVDEMTETSDELETMTIEPEAPEEITAEVVTVEPVKPATESDSYASTPVVETPAEEELSVEVVGYDTYTDDDGNRADIATVTINDREFLVADIDMDGVADVMAADIDDNGRLDPYEICDVREHDIAMQSLKDEYMADNDGLLAANDDSDFINDANVEDYIA